MILQKVSFCFLILFVTFCNGNSKDFEITELCQDILDNFRQNSRYYDGRPVNVNKLFDPILPKIREDIVSNGFEPITLPNLNEHTIPLPKLLRAKINLQKGYLHYMSNVYRSENVTMQYENKRIIFNFPLIWIRLNLNYDYYLKYLFFNKRGDIYGRADDVEFNVKLEWNLKNYNVVLHEVKVLRYHAFELNVQGNKIDPVMNTIVSAMTRFFRNYIINLVEDKAQNLFVPLVNSLNRKIKKPKSKYNKLID